VVDLCWMDLVGGGFVLDGRGVWWICVGLSVWWICVGGRSVWWMCWMDSVVDLCWMDVVWLEWEVSATGTPYRRDLGVVKATQNTSHCFSCGVEI
jgi:hypothetical protein